MRKAIAGVLMGAAVLSLAACGKSDTAQTTAAQAAESADSTAAAVDTEDKKEIVYGKSQGPYTELFEAAIVPILEKEGYTVKGVDFSDLQTADIGLNDGDVDVNVEQHAAYAENFNANYNADLVPISRSRLYRLAYILQNTHLLMRSRTVRRLQFRTMPPTPQDAI